MNKAPGGVGTMLLLSDGSVMVGDSNSASKSWYRLQPDSNGHYVHGTWTVLPNSNCPHGFFASQLLMDGRVFVAGGENPNPPTSAFGSGCAYPAQSDGTVGQQNTGVDTELYDPVANEWTKFLNINGKTVNPADPPTALIDPTQNTNFPSLCGTQSFADMISETLPDGRVLMAPVCPKNCGDTLIFDPKSYNPSIAGSGWLPQAAPLANTGGNAFSCNQQEATWVKLTDGSILTADPPVLPGDNQTSERFFQNQWVTGVPLGFSLFDTEFGYTTNLGSDGEEGPAFLLPNGNAFLIGGAPVTGLYIPGAPQAFYAWTPASLAPMGPATGQASLSADDAPGATMVNGKILLALNFAATPVFPLPTPIFFYEFDPFQNTFAEVPGPGNSGAPSVWSDCGATTMLVLPDGTVLMPSGCDNTQLYVYQPSGQPLTQGQPSISGISFNSGTSFHLNGLGLTGISEGASFGDDAQMASNYPLVRLTDSGGRVQYARTFNWSSTGVQVSGTESTDFSVSQKVLAATQPYSLQVGVNGYWSASVPFPCQSGESWNASASKCEATTVAVCTTAGRTSGCPKSEYCVTPGGYVGGPVEGCKCLRCSSQVVGPCIGKLCACTSPGPTSGCPTGYYCTEPGITQCHCLQCTLQPSGGGTPGR